MSWHSFFSSCDPSKTCLFKVIICIGGKNLIGTHNKSKVWNTYEHCLECMIWKSQSPASACCKKVRPSTLLQQSKICSNFSVWALETKAVGFILPHPINKTTTIIFALHWLMINSCWISNGLIFNDISGPLSYWKSLRLNNSDELFQLSWIVTRIWSLT